MLIHKIKLVNTFAFTPYSFYMVNEIGNRFLYTLVYAK
jgi:hypothetical protein